jgi:hypothetical protein
MKDETLPLVKDALEATTAAIASKASTATYVGAVGSIVAFMASAQFVAIAGLAIGVLGFIVNWYYRRKEYRLREAAERREREVHEARMKRYMAGFDPLPEAGAMGEET